MLIACSNVANLLLVRFSGRRREIALRMAIGASRTSVVRLFVFESLLVSLSRRNRSAPCWPGSWSRSSRKWRRIFCRSIRAQRVNLSFPVLGFTVGLSLLTGLLMGIYPAFKARTAIWSMA